MAESDNIHWYLRPVDFRPEKIVGNTTKYYRNERTALEQLSEAGNLFDSERDAMEASIAIRAYLNRLIFVRRERQEYARRNRMQFDNNQPNPPINRP